MNLMKKSTILKSIAIFLTGISAGIGFDRALPTLEKLVKKQPVPVIQTLPEEPQTIPKRGDIHAVIATGYIEKGTYREAMDNVFLCIEALKNRGAKLENIKLLLDNPENLPLPYNMTAEKPTARKVLDAIINAPVDEFDDFYVPLSGDYPARFKGISYLDNPKGLGGSMLSNEDLERALSEKKCGRLIMMIRNEIAEGYTSRKYCNEARDGAMCLTFKDEYSYGKFLKAFSNGSNLLESLNSTLMTYVKKGDISAPGATFYAPKGETYIFIRHLDGWENRKFSSDEFYKSFPALKNFMWEKPAATPDTVDDKSVSAQKF